MILHPDGEGLVAVAQSAHAFLAFQLAAHWGNRLTSRPSPHAEVLVAALLHDAGWDGRETPPRLAADRRPVAFDTLPDAEREAVWAAAVDRAALRGRYVAYLVSHHVSTLAEMGREGVHREFLTRQETLRAHIREELGGDPRYAGVLGTPADEANRAIVRLTDAVAVHLACGREDPVRLAGVPRRGGSAPMTVERAAEATYRLRPWPLLGRRLVVTAEGRRLPAREFADQESLTRAWREATTVRLTWTLLPPGAVSD
jgi:Protein of unknown function (DUF3891)